MKNILELPKQAGPVPLIYSEGALWPVRNTSTLDLPRQDGMEFHPLKGGEQFLLEYPRTSAGGQWRRQTLFFGGMDESPFITGIEEDAVKAFRTGGEDAFFEAIKPVAIKTLSKKFPEAKVRRQGDIWSIALPVSWLDLASTSTPLILPKGISRRKKRRRLALSRKQMRPLQPPSTTFKSSVLRTNHMLDGYSVALKQVRIGDTTVYGVVVAEGILTAQDHAPHELIGTPHILARTPHLSPVITGLGWE